MANPLGKPVSTRPGVVRPAPERPRLPAIESLETLWDPRALRERWLSDLSELFDHSLRSPLFVAWLRYALLTTVTAQQLWLGKSAAKEPLVPQVPKSAAPDHEGEPSHDN